MVRTPTVVVVDSDEDSAERAARTLERSGYEARRRRPPVRAATLETDVSAVVTEIDLPTDGLEFAAEVLERRPSLSVVVYTDAGSEAVASRAITVGVDEYVSKRHGPEALRQALDRTLDRTRGDEKADPGRSEGNGSASSKTADPGWSLGEFPPQYPVGALVVTEGGRIVDANDRACSLLGLDRAAVDADCRRTTDRRAELAPVSLPLERLFAAGEAVSDVRRTIEVAGEKRHLSIAAAPLSDRRRGRAFVTVRDVTERVERERELERYRTIVESADDMIYALDDEGRITLVNESFARHFERSRAELLGTDVAELIPDDAYDLGRELVLALLRTDETNRGRFEFEIDDSSGERRHVESNVTLLYDDEDAFQGSVGIVRDVTRRKRQASALERQNERLEDFASIVSHDLRNPLNVIDGSITLYRETGDPEYLAKIDSCTDRMETMIADLLELAREGEDVTSVEPVSLERAALDAWRTVETTHAELSLSGDLGTLEADGDRLRQLLENLFRNAVEHGSTSSGSPALDDADHDRAAGFDPRGGEDTDADGTTVTVTVERTDDGFAVADDGPGVDPAVADRAFERGVTSSDEGTGLGLGIVRRIVRAHEWSVELDDGADGARFVVRTE